MAIGKEVKTKIASIGSTQKITSAMEMVAASKMRKAQDRMALGKPYAQRIRDVVGHIANAVSEYKHPYLVEREVKRVAYIVISTDRGLCGGLNINLFKAALKSMKAWSDQGVEVDICVVGNKAAASEISQIKVVAPNIALKVIDRAIQMHGGAGVCQDVPLAEMYANQRTLRLADGPDEVHRMLVARRELAKYRD